MIKASSRGFTLIELMIVVAVVAILAAIAYPSYRDSVLKGRAPKEGLRSPSCYNRKSVI